MSAGVTLLRAPCFDDARGWFSQTWSAARQASQGLAATFVQDNQSFSVAAGTVRGIHFQIAPQAQAKLVRCVRGAVMDCVVDLRRGSPTYGRHLAVQLTAMDRDQLFIPIGFGHGFVTLEAETEVAYKVSAPYAPDCERGLRWDDPALGVAWPLPSSGAVMSERDAVWPTLAELAPPFENDGRPFVLERA